MTQEFDAIEFSSFFFENANKFAANDFSLLFGISHAGEFAKEAFGGVDIDEIGVKLIAEDFDNIFGFAFTHKAVVDVNANEIVAYSLEQ